jgi:hypothetical protein
MAGQFRARRRRQAILTRRGVDAVEEQCSQKFGDFTQCNEWLNLPLKRKPLQTVYPFLGFTRYPDHVQVFYYLP